MILVFTACRADIPPKEITSMGCSSDALYESSTDSFDYVKKHMVSTLPIGPFIFYPEEEDYNFPILNPINNQQIIFSVQSPGGSGLPYEIRKHDFCTGQSEEISSNFYFNLDWSSKGNISFTGIGGDIYILDSLGNESVITSLPGTNKAGKWNPSGTLIWNERSDGTDIIDIDGNIVREIVTNPFSPEGWISDSVMIGATTNSILLLSIIDESTTTLFSGAVDVVSPLLHDPHENCMYSFRSMGSGQTDYMLKHSLDGSNSVDTIKNMYDSYTYGGGDVGPEYLLLLLGQKDWRDSVNNEINFKRRLILMDKVSFKDRLIQFE